MTSVRRLHEVVKRGDDWRRSADLLRARGRDGVGGRMPTLRISDADAIAYDDAGEGPVIVLVHGSPGTSRAWQPVAERLTRRFRVISPNLPGYGATTRPVGEGPGDSSYAAGLIEALIAEVGPPAVLAGHSYGGVVALMTALRGRIKPPRAVSSSGSRRPTTP